MVLTRNLILWTQWIRNDGSHLVSLLLWWFLLPHIALLIVEDLVIHLHLCPWNIIRLDVIARRDVSVLVNLGGARNILDHHVVAKESTLGWWAEVLQFTFTLVAEWRRVLKSFKALIWVTWRLSIEFFVISTIVSSGNVIGSQRQQFPLGFAVELSWLRSNDVVVAQ